jgi:hypothetical protein
MLTNTVEMSTNAGETAMAVENIPGSLSEKPNVDIEHVPVKDDPRTWSLFRKVCETWIRCHGGVVYADN